MAILNDTELTTDEERKITNSLNETEIETIESDIMIKTQDEYECKQKRISSTIMLTLISVLCAIAILFCFAMIVFANIFAPQH